MRHNNNLKREIGGSKKSPTVNPDAFVSELITSSQTVDHLITRLAWISRNHNLSLFSPFSIPRTGGGEASVARVLLADCLPEVMTKFGIDGPIKILTFLDQRDAAGAVIRKRLAEEAPDTQLSKAAPIRIFGATRLGITFDTSAQANLLGSLQENEEFRKYARVLVGIDPDSPLTRATRDFDVLARRLSTSSGKFEHDPLRKALEKWIQKLESQYLSFDGRAKQFASDPKSTLLGVMSQLLHFAKHAEVNLLYSAFTGVNSPGYSEPERWTVGGYLKDLSQIAHGLALLALPDSGNALFTQFLDQTILPPAAFNELGDIDPLYQSDPRFKLACEADLARLTMALLGRDQVLRLARSLSQAASFNAESKNNPSQWPRPPSQFSLYLFREASLSVPEKTYPIHPRSSTIALRDENVRARDKFFSRARDTAFFMGTPLQNSGLESWLVNFVREALERGSSFEEFRIRPGEWEDTPQRIAQQLDDADRSAMYGFFHLDSDGNLALSPPGVAWLRNRLEQMERQE